MPHNTQFDSFEPQTLDFPYSRIQDELSEEQRFVAGTNMMVTLGGKLSRRPGTKVWGTVTTSVRADRGWFVESLDTPAYGFLVFTGYNYSTSFWEIWYMRLDSTTPVPAAYLQPWTDIRDLKHSTAPHIAAVSKGLLFIKGFPAAGSTEKLGTVIFDPSGGVPNFRPWGLLGPTVPAQLAPVACQITTLTQDMSALDLNLYLEDFTGPGSPLVGSVYQIDYEQVQYQAPGVGHFVVSRGYNGTALAPHRKGARCMYREWAASDHFFVVNQYWEYSYGWITADGHYSNRAPAEINPDNPPSRTGPFFAQIPRIVVRGHPDTTNVTKVAIYRTTDGGGTFYLLDTIDNPGDTSVVYDDKTLWSTDASGDPIQNDPLPDELLTSKDPSPDLNSNSPPPTVLSPKVTGTDAPARSTPMVYFQGRLWYGIGNVLFGSAQEEITLGVPEASWPSGGKGLFYRFQHPLTNLVTDDQSLYIFTTHNTLMMQGNNLETFNVSPLFDNYGHPWGHPRGVARFGGTVVFLSHDYRICIIENGVVIVISDALGDDVDAAIEAGAEIELSYYGNLEKDWLFVAAHRKDDPTKSRQWVYDIKKSRLVTLQGGFYSPRKHFWFVPWTYPATVCTSLRTSQTSSQRKLVFHTWNTSSHLGVWVTLDDRAMSTTDYFQSGAATFDMSVTSNLMRVPTGNHVNAKRQAELSSVLYSIVLERTSYPGDADPDVAFYKDDVWTNPRALPPPEDPARRPPSTGYKALEYGVWEAGQRFAFQLSKTGSADPFELHTYHFTFSPDSGA